MSNNQWFQYPVKAQPHHTDYAGIVWHGSYINWMEEARVQYLTNQGVEYTDLIALGCELPVVEMSLRYHKGMKLGTSAIVKSRISSYRGVRIQWEQNIFSAQEEHTYVTAQITLVAVDRQNQKILRQPPHLLQNILGELTS
ncbi:MAG: thioesterase family protein [Xenococcaceae cyanobacterium MO_167.B27]|nr:thioesterase family protein [Xenococcaceae cyanobacterium MO_167.B27]